MDQNYKPIHQQADKLWYKFQDIVDDKTDSLAGSAQHEIKEIVECIEMNKAPRAIEDRIRQVQQLMEKVRAGSSHMMTPEDAAFMIHEYERLREQVRKLPNY
jgi:hypothetical protein